MNIYKYVIILYGINYIYAWFIYTLGLPIPNDIVHSTI